MQKWVEEINTKEPGVSIAERSRDGNGWINILLSVWVIISPFVFTFHSSKAIWNNVVSGAVVGILAFVRWSMHQPGMELAQFDSRDMARYFAIRAFSRHGGDVEQRHSGDNHCRVGLD